MEKSAGILEKKEGRKFRRKKGMKNEEKEGGQKGGRKRKGGRKEGNSRKELPSGKMGAQ